MGRESEEQKFIFEWATYNYKKYPELEKLMFCIPNGGSRNKLEAISLKKQGTKAGVSDLTVQVARGGYHGLWIELKVGKNKASEKQLEFIEAVRNEGYCARIVCGGLNVIELIKDYMDGRIQREL